MTKKVVMAIDDSKTVLFTFRKILEKNGYEAQCFETPREAADYIKENKFPDFIVLDRMLRSASGDSIFYDLIKLNPDAKIIMASSLEAGEDTKQKFFKDGLKDYLHKPVTEEKLIETIKKYIK